MSLRKRRTLKKEQRKQRKIRLLNPSLKRLQRKRNL
jgi:hypothetical protein